MNEYDSNKMAEVLYNSHQMELTTDIHAINLKLILFNTCSVRAKAEQKLLSDLGRIRPLKEKNPMRKTL